MKPNLAFALASQPLVVLTFSGTTGTSSQYLPTAGGIAADGIPIPYNGTLVSLSVFDGTTLYTDQADVTFVANDRVAIYCQNVGGSFTVKARLNGVSTTLQTASVPLSSTLIVTLVLAINRV